MSLPQICKHEKQVYYLQKRRSQDLSPALPAFAECFPFPENDSGHFHFRLFTRFGFGDQKEMSCYPVLNVLQIANTIHCCVSELQWQKYFCHRDTETLKNPGRHYLINPDIPHLPLHHRWHARYGLLHLGAAHAVQVKQEAEHEITAQHHVAGVFYVIVAGVS